jgi:hypothetical protein
MKCKKVLSQLSGFVDEILDTRGTIQISQHLDQCAACNEEYERLTFLRKKLGSLGKIPAPNYLWHMIGLQIAAAQQDTFCSRLRSALEYRWSKIRTTEGIWYWTRILGTVMTSFFFVAITSALNPAYIDLPRDTQNNGTLRQNIRQQLPAIVLRNLGIISMEAQRRPIHSSNPMINDLYLLNFGQSMAHQGKDDSFSVVTIVDRSGSAKIQSVLEYPDDQTLLNNFNSMILSARCRPASQNGRTIEAPMVLTFSKISVYD